MGGARHSIWGCVVVGVRQQIGVCSGGVQYLINSSILRTGARLMGVRGDVRGVGG